MNINLDDIRNKNKYTIFKDFHNYLLNYVTYASRILKKKIKNTSPVQQVNIIITGKC